jgi:hypothetical protein
VKHGHGSGIEDLPMFVGEAAHHGAHFGNKYEKPGAKRPGVSESPAHKDREPGVRALPVFFRSFGEI